MRLTRVLAIAAIATASAYGTAEAQSSSSARVPAEFPPASYTGRQYVDSRGCVFIRAGIDGQVTWIPRVSRDRKVICGFKPSLSTATARAAPKPAPAPATKPVEITVPAQTATAAPAPKPTPAPKATKTVRKTAAPKKQKPVTKRVTKPKQITPVPSPKVVTAKPKKQSSAKPAKRVVRTAQTPARAQPACQTGNATSQQYVRVRNGMPVRCGPQSKAPHSTVLSGGGGSGTATRVVRTTPATTQPVVRSANTFRVSPSSTRTVTGQSTRVAPRRVYERQLSSTAGITVPEGYQPVWNDDRLNPRRAHQTLEGKAQMDLAWTKTVPRLLIDRRTGREVTYKYPGLQYPYTSFADQRAAGVHVATRGRVVQDPIPVVRNRDGDIVNPRATKTRRTKVASNSTVAPKVSTRSRAAASRTVVKKAATHRYVQAGVFGNPANAKRAAQKIANSGLPARMGNVKRNGKSYTLVLAGPFQSQDQLQKALRQVRGAGFSDAFPRK